MENLAYHPDFGGRVRFDFEAMPDDPDGQVAQTMDKIRALSREDADHPLIAEHAARALRLGYGPTRNYAGQAIAGVWDHVTRSIKFKQDAELANALQTDDPRIADVVEVVIRPIDQARLIDTRGGVEDCDGFEGYASSLLTRLGIPWSLVTVAAEPRRPAQFSHVYLAAYVDGVRIPLDFSHGPYPGWECPNLGRIKEWPGVVSPQSAFCSGLVVLGFVAALYIGYRAISSGSFTR